MAARGPRIIVALDYADPATADALVEQLDPGACRLKVGSELFTRCGPQQVSAWIERGFDVFLDLKYHDIPNTVAASSRAAADLGVWMITVHAAGGRRMLEAARAAVEGKTPRPLVVAVTVLTSMTAADLGETGIIESPDQAVVRLARLAASAGCDGAVCSAHEAAGLRAARGDAFTLVTPGIRAPGADADDQRRTMAPAEAIAAGADYLVVGRPITAAADPAAALAHLRHALAPADGEAAPD